MSPKLMLLALGDTVILVAVVAILLAASISPSYSVGFSTDHITSASSPVVLAKTTVANITFLIVSLVKTVVVASDCCFVIPNGNVDCVVKSIVESFVCDRFVPVVNI